LPPPPPLAPRTPAGERRLALAVTAAGIVTTLVLVALLVASISTGDAIAGAIGHERLDVEITGHQFWWEVRYPVPSRPDLGFTTANELHVPVGVTVRLVLGAGDVIHSFWVPRLHGKLDLIPGRTTRLWLRADRAGTYAGQCAEFCGLQHAHMGLRVVAEPPAAFAAWRARQLAPAALPRTPVEQHGQRVFLSSPCVLCHSIRGTLAGGQQAPDLTHLASRATLAAGTLPNRADHLSGWVRDAQRVKPGSNMPPSALAGPDLQALLAYLRSLS
jgi:cytochrome c oxidase subunit 2